MRVLLTCLSDFRAPGARQTLRLAAALEEVGHETLVLIEGDLDTIRFAAEQDLGLDYDRYRFTGPLLDRRTRRRAEAFRPDVVHCYEPRTAPLSASIQLSRLADCPLCVRFADDDEALAREAGGTSLRGRLGRPAMLVLGTALPRRWPYKHPLLYRRMFAQASGYDAITPALAESVAVRYGVSCEGILPAIARSAPPQREEGLRMKLGLPSRGALVAYTGSVYRAQYPDFELLLRAFAILSSRDPEVRLVHSGRIAPRYERSTLLGLAGVGADRVHLLGFLEDPADLGALMAESTALVQPGAPTDFNRLRLPAKVHDYLLAERPTVTFRAGFGELLEDRREAVLTNGPEPDELADALEWILADPGRAAAIASRGREKALTLFDPTSVALQTTNYYGRAIEDFCG